MIPFLSKWLQERRTAPIARELDLRLAQRRLDRRKRSEAAQRGHSTEIRNRARKCREVFS